MYSKKFIAGAAVAVALLPTLALGQSTDTQAKIQSLLSQIQELQRQVMVLISSAGVFKPIGTEGTGIVSGKITAVNDSSITVQNREGTKSTIVNYTASTTIEVFNASSTPQWQTGSATDLTVGKGVAVQGTKATENAVDATRIKVGILLTGQERLVNVPPGQVSKALCISLDRNLGPGSRGEDVRQLQEMLRADPDSGFSATATGFFGPITGKAMMMYQRKNGITPADDGSVGPLTRGALMRTCGQGLGVHPTTTPRTNMPMWDGRPTPVPPSPTTTPGDVCTMEAAVCPAGQHAGGTCNHECLPDDTSASSTESGGT